MERWKLEWWEKLLAYGGRLIFIGLPTAVIEWVLFTVFGTTLITIVLGFITAFVAGISYLASIAGLLFWTE